MNFIDSGWNLSENELVMISIAATIDNLRPISQELQTVQDFPIDYSMMQYIYTFFFLFDVVF